MQKRRGYNHRFKAATTTASRIYLPPRRYRRPYCGNCGRNGHCYRDCREPFTSLGIIAIRNSIHDTIVPLEVLNILDSLPEATTNEEAIDSSLRCLMVQRKDSLGFINILRPRPEEEFKYLNAYAEDLTWNERKALKTKNFDELWRIINNNNNYYNRDTSRVKERFESLDINQVLDSTASKFNFQEWGFPKGKRDRYERDLNSALREFEEETGYHSKDLKIISGSPLVERFIGLNNNRYMCKYFVALMNTNIGPPVIDQRKHHQAGEVSNIAWLTYSDAAKIIRPNALDKKRVLKQAFTLAQYKQQKTRN